MSHLADVTPLPRRSDDVPRARPSGPDADRDADRAATSDSDANADADADANANANADADANANANADADANANANADADANANADADADADADANADADADADANADADADALWRRIAQRAGSGGVFFVDPAGIVRGWTDSARRLFGYAADAVVGRPLTALLPFVAGGDAIEGWCRRADGTPFRGEVVLIHDGGGSEHLAPLIVVDVTARHQAEESARHMRQRLRELTASMARLVTYSIDIERGEVEVSEGFAELIGWGPAGSPRRLDDLLQLCQPDDREALARQIAHAISARGSFDIECRVRRGPGERWLHVVGGFVDVQPPRLVGTGMDITERRRAAAEHAASEARLQAVLDAAVDGLMTIDEHGHIESVNRAVTTLLRCPAAALVGADCRAYLELPADALPFAPEPARGRLHDVTGCRGDGSLVPIECGFSQVQLGERRLGLVVMRDVSERRMLERQVLDVSEQLQRQIGQDLHDGLGQLLTGTAFLAKGLQSSVDAEAEPQARRVVELINQAITRVRSLARGLSPIHVEAQGLEAVLRHVVAESSKLLAVECVLELRDPIEADRPATLAQLCLIAREAITNAVRHGQARRIVVSLARRGAGSMMAIEDDGIGIGEAEGPVEGLGLRSMRHRARLIGGTLEVARAEVGRGMVVRCSWSE